MTVARGTRKGNRKMDLSFDAADFVLFTNLIRPSTAGYTGLLRWKYSSAISTSVVSKS
jgi:hypothetical protein